MVKPGARTADLTIPNTKVPAKGALQTTASGNGATEVAAGSSGTITVKVGDFSADIQTYKGTTKDLLIPVKCTLQTGQNATLGTIAVGTPPTSPTSTPTGTGTPTSTPTSTGTPTSTATGTGTATSTATGTTTSTGVTGPPIITDGGSTGSGMNGGVLGGAAVAAAGIGALGFGIRRRLTDKK